MAAGVRVKTWETTGHLRASYACSGSVTTRPHFVPEAVLCVNTKQIAILHAACFAASVYSYVSTVLSHKVQVCGCTMHMFCERSGS